VKNPEGTFAEVERRVRSIVAENRSLRGRIRELEGELERLRRDGREYESFRGKKIRVREKVERMLKELEAVAGNDDARADAADTGGRQ
jgi:dynactin complex subunit